MLIQLSRYILCIALLFSHASVAQIEITDSHGKYKFDKPPERIVVLNWALAEHLLELEVTPVGMADIAGFTKVANKPEIPQNPFDVGNRLNPNLNKIRELKPEIILIGYSQRSLIRPLSNIATVIYFKNFGHRYNNYQKSRERFTELAKLFNKTELAKTKLATMDEQLTELRASLHRAYEDKPLPNVQLQTQSNHADPTTWLFGNNSMPYYAALELGLNVLSNPENDKFGVAKLTQTELSKLRRRTLGQLSMNETDNGPVSQSSNYCQLTLSNYSADAIKPTLNTNEKTKQCTADLSYQNAFGGSFSILYLAQAIHQALTDDTYN